VCSSDLHAGTLVYITVADINATLAKINAKGGKTLLPRMAIGEYGFIAHFEDSEGNRVALHSVN
jgi:predicted enzyme related to lactoylglutathione lyase